MRVWPRRPNPAAVARIASHGTRVVPGAPAPGVLREPPPTTTSTEKTTTAERTAVARPVAQCGHCSHGVDGHGTQYGALVGWHTWAPEIPERPKYWSEICTPEGDPR